MKPLPSNKLLMERYRLSEERLLILMHKCINYYLSEEELYKFIEEYYFKLENRYNKRYQQ